MTLSATTPSSILCLIGFSFTGKTSVGREVARRLRWAFVDTDEEIVARAGKPVPDIFAQDGEGRFRALEREVLQDFASRQRVVISTGGGIVLEPGNRQLMLERGMVVCLEAKPETIYHRLRTAETGSSGDAARPLLAGENPLERIRYLKEFRQPYYAMGDWTIHTDNLTTEGVVEEVLRCKKLLDKRPESTQRYQFPPSTSSARESQAPYCQEQGAAFMVNTPSASYPVFVGWGILSELGERVRNTGVGGSAFIISDTSVSELYGGQVQKSLERARLKVASYAIPAGEESKSLAWAERLYQWLVSQRAERSDAIIALGGGVVGDLAGFVAATFARGLPLIQVPTSLLAMVDASIGGKVAVNLPQAKNLVGAFYQPRMVFMDVESLQTLPQRELTSGWAEVIKHALILDPSLLKEMEVEAPRLRALDRELTPQIISRSSAIKGRLVGEDEKETLGKRIILNYGHTIGHALEAATGYQALLHGEAVAIGMMGAALIGNAIGVTPAPLVERQRKLLSSYGLPLSYKGMDAEAVQQAMGLDKKVSGGSIQWVLLEEAGKTVLRKGVPQDVVRKVVEKLLS